MVDIQVERFKGTEEANDVNIHGKTDFEHPSQTIKGNFTIIHHEATLEQKFDKVEIREIHEMICESIICFTILRGTIAFAIFIMCAQTGFKKCQSTKNDTKSHRFQPKKKRRLNPKMKKKLKCQT